MKPTILAASLVTMALMSNALAATSTCPPVQTIEQASQPDERVWRGENPQASASDLADFIFHDAQYDQQNKTVICTYTGPMGNDASFSVMLKPVAGWNLTPVGDWRGTYCESTDVAKCSYTHQ